MSREMGSKNVYESMFYDPKLINNPSYLDYYSNLAKGRCTYGCCQVLPRSLPPVGSQTFFNPSINQLNDQQINPVPMLYPLQFSNQPPIASNHNFLPTSSGTQPSSQFMDPLRTGFPSQRLDSHVSHPRSVSNSTEAMESLKRQNEEEVEEDEEEEVEVEVEVELPYEDYTRPRTQFNGKRLQRLEAEFKTNNYPNLHIRQKIADELKLTILQVTTWFGNRRTRKRRAAALAVQRNQLYPESSVQEN